MYLLDRATTVSSPADLVEICIVNGLGQCKPFGEIAEEIVSLLTQCQDFKPIVLGSTDA